VNKEFARKLVTSPSDKTTKELFQGVDGVFWVDWREADDDIVSLASKAIPGIDLAPVWIDGKLNIRFQGKLTEIPLKFKPGEQDITLRSLNQAIAPALEIRFVRASDGGDTIALIILDKKSWAELESDYGAKVAEAFQKLESNNSFFDDEGGGETQGGRQTATAPELKNAMFRLQTTAFVDSLRRDPNMTDASMPVVKPLCGDIVLMYLPSAETGSPYVTEGVLRESGLSREALHDIAEANASSGSRKMEFGKPGIVRQMIVEQLASAINVLEKSLRMSAGFVPVVVAFPQTQLVLFANAEDPEAVRALREAVDRMDFSSQSALSKHLYVWKDNSWQLKA
jgi:hypothetical protein